MQLTRIRLENFRCFAQLDLVLHPQLTLVFGPNGVGKTTTLQALTALLGALGRYSKREGEIEPLPGLVPPALTGADIRDQFFVHENDFLRAPHSPALLSAEGALWDEQLAWSLHINKADSPEVSWREGTRELRKLTQTLGHSLRRGEPVLLPALAFYGADRRWRGQGEEAQETPDRDGALARTDGYQDTFDPVVDAGTLRGWWRWANRIEREEDRSYKPLQAVREAVATTLGSKELPRYSSQVGDIMLDLPGLGWRRFLQLSDGYRAFLGMVADLARRCAILNPQLGQQAAKDSPGVVLIDELDLHLHPDWQLKVVDQLLRAFPKMQFIVTTHSDQVLSTVPARQVIKLVLDGDAVSAESVQDTYGYTSEHVAGLVMGVPDRPDNTLTRTLSRYRTLVVQGQGRSEEGQRLRSELQSSELCNDPELVTLNLEIERQERLRQRKSPT